MSFVLWPLGYLVVGALLGGLVAPATRSDGRERREILAMFITAWPLICAITIAIHGVLLLSAYRPSWSAALKWLGWTRWLSGEGWPL
jgi:uncharacterized membrane protein